MSVHKTIIRLAGDVHRAGWKPGSHVGVQTRRSNRICREWQAAVKQRYSTRFASEHRLNRIGRSQQIDLVDLRARIAYELKASPNNVHMEIYRDVFKALVFNLRNPGLRVRKLVFIAPAAGINKLGVEFPRDVRKIAAKLGLQLELAPI